MNFTFLKAQGYDIGTSLLDEKIDVCSDYMKRAEAAGKKLLVPRTPSFRQLPRR